MTLSIAPLDDASVDALVELWRRCGLVVPYNDPAADIRLARDTPSAEVFVGREPDGRLVAGLMCGSDGHRGWIYYVAVDPERRGQGYGGRMVRHAEDWLHAVWRIPKAQLLVRETNVAVRRFYEALGYEAPPRLYMERWLDAEAAAIARRHRAARDVEAVRTVLEMRAPPTRPTLAAPAGIKLAVMRAERPTPAFYRFLYGEVGRPCHWVDRLALDDEALTRIVHDPAVEVHVLWADGQPVGFAELDRRRKGDVELAYFGLVPAFLGRGLGWFLLNWAVDAAWLGGGVDRLWVRTTSLDHPRAIVNYQRAGFVPIRQERFTVRPPDGGPRG